MNAGSDATIFLMSPAALAHTVLHKLLVCCSEERVSHTQPSLLILPQDLS